MTPRYSVTFALLPRPHRDGTHSVALTVTWQRQRYRHTLPVSCPPDCWDGTVQLARPRGTFHAVSEVNTAVLDARQQDNKRQLKINQLSFFVGNKVGKRLQNHLPKLPQQPQGENSQQHPKTAPLRPLPP